MGIQSPQRPEEGAISLGTGVVDSCEPPCKGGNWTWLLCRGSLWSESSFQPSSYSLRDGLSRNLELISSGMPAKELELFPFPSSQCWVYRHTCSGLVFTWVLGFLIQFLMLAWQVLCCLSHLSSHSLRLLTGLSVVTSYMHGTGADCKPGVCWINL